MESERDTTKYELYKKGGKSPVYRGITSRPLEERIKEHEQGGKDFDTWKKIGNKTTREGARNWEREQNERKLPPENIRIAQAKLPQK